MIDWMAQRRLNEWIRQHRLYLMRTVSRQIAVPMEPVLSPGGR